MSKIKEITCKCSHWISVKDKLPTRDNKIICCLVNGKHILANVHDATICFAKGNLSFYWPTTTWIKDEYYAAVTHWMPLPEPPKDE